MFLGLSAYLAGLTLGYHPSDPSYFSVSIPKSHIENFAGSWGASVSGFLFFYLGLSAYLIPVPFLITFLIGLSRKKYFFKTLMQQLLYCGLLILCFGQLCAITSPLISFKGYPLYTAGTIGDEIYNFVQQFLGPWGHSILTLGFFFLSLVLIFQKPLILDGFKVKND